MENQIQIKWSKKLKLKPIFSGCCWRIPAFFLLILVIEFSRPCLAFVADKPPPRTVATEISESRIASAIKQLDSLALGLMQITRLPGLAVAVVWQGKIAFAKGLGLRQIGREELVDANTVFQIASLSKPIAATVVAQQVGEGVVTWDTPVIAHLPWFSLSDSWVTSHVTLGDMFAHRSGLPDHGGDDLEDLGYSRREILERLRFLPLSPFRSKYAYTNFGLTAAAEAVAQASGKDWADLSQEAIYGPLGMVSTSSRYADYLAQENRALGHSLVDGQFDPNSVRQPDAQSPAGGVSSNVKDMARWMIMVLGNGQFDEQTIIDRQALLPAITGKIFSSPSRTPDARASLYGFGFGASTQPSGRVILSHSGAFYLGAGSNFMMMPSEDLGIIALSNGTPIGAVEALTAQFMDLVQFGEVTRDWVTAYAGLMAPLTEPIGKLVGKPLSETFVPADDLQSYTGPYENDYFGPAIVELAQERVVLTIGPENQKYPLNHWNGDQFYIEMFGENSPKGSRSLVTFARDADERVSSMNIELLNQNGLGTFVR